MKPCTHCGLVKDPSEFPIRADRQRLRPYCRECANRMARELYEDGRTGAKQSAKLWRHNNRDKRNANKAKYRAQKQGHTVKLTRAQYAEIRAYYTRARMLTKLTGEVYHVDHIVPLNHPKVCGLHVPWNLQVLPGKLNMKKSNRVSLDAVARSPLQVGHANEA